MSRSARLVVLLLLLFGVVGPLRAGARPAASPGHLDPTFGTSGKVKLTVATTAGGEDGATAVRTLPDGSFLVSAWADRSGSRDFALLKFKQGGSLDTNFGGGDGIVYTDFNG